jgi:hypothetical protein
MAAFVVVLQNDEAGVTVFPNVPDSAGLTALMRSQVQGHNVQDPPKYLRGMGSVVSFTMDREKAQIFGSQSEAQAAIDRIPAMVRPDGLSVQALDG